MKMGYALSKLIVHKSNWNKPSKFLSNMGLGAYTKAVKPRKTDLDWLSYNEENVKRYIADPYCGHQDTQGFWREFLKGMSHLYESKMLKKLSPRKRRSSLWPGMPIRSEIAAKDLTASTKCIRNMA
jgi:alpha-beta hydrolase superfamily lysophospholipase